MIRLTVAAAICVLFWSPAGVASAAPVSEATVDGACGDQIEGGCSGATCATGCQKMENGKLYDYGCTFPNKAGKTKATCRNIQVGRTVQGDSGNTAVGGTSPLLKAD